MRLFVADAGLRGNIGHHANGCRHIVFHARARGIDTHVLAHKEIDESLRAELRARRFFQAYVYVFTDGDPYCGWLSGFHKSAAATAEDLTTLSDIRREDIVFVHGAQPAQLMAAIEWVRRQPENKCPLVLVELATEPGVEVEREGSRMLLKIPDPQLDSRPTLYRFAALNLKTIGEKPLRVITYNSDVSAIYSELLGASVGVLPFPTPADTKLRDRSGRRPITISVLGHQQFRKGYHLVPAVIERMLRTRTDVNFLIHNSDPEQKQSAGSVVKHTQDAIRQMASADSRVKLEARAVGFEEWVALLDASDLILCPYDPLRYANGHSGLASQAIANGIPLIVPSPTPLSRWLDDFGSPGVTFDRFDEESVIAAVERAVDNYDVYATRALAAATRWGSLHGPERFVDALVTLQQARLKGSLPAVVNVSVKPSRPARGSEIQGNAPGGKATGKSMRGKTVELAAKPVRKSALQHLADGIRFAADNDLERALGEFDSALRTSPTSAEAWFCRAMALESVARLGEAYDSYAQAVMLAPGYAAAEEKLASLAAPAGRPPSVLTPWKRTPAPGPGARARHWLARISGRRQDFRYRYSDADEGTLRVRLLDNPGSADVATALGRVLMNQGRTLEAELFFRYALQLRPWDGEAAMRLCSVLERSAASTPEIRDIVMRAISAGATDPRLPGVALWAELALGRWEDFAKLMELTMRGFERTPACVSPFTMLHFTDDPGKHKACAAAFFTEMTGAIAPPLPASAAARLPKLTIGYLSADFREHAVAHLFAELFELHDRKRFRVVGFSTFNGEIASIGKRVRGAFDEFRDLTGQKPELAAQRIRDFNVDILVDLTGHTANPQSEILAARPAPVLVNFLGYPGTLGTEVVDYIIADRIVAPTEQQSAYSEALVHMPATYQVNDRKRPRGEARLSRAQAGLPESAVVFCCFNETRKVQPATFKVWMRILRRVPEGVLWLYAGNPLAVENLRAEAAKEGVDPARVIFAAKVRHEEHLSRYRLADLFLDTQPYGAHTTASDALWVGCPVLTLCGQAFAGRVGASLLSAVGLPELITRSWEEYENKAVQISSDRQELARLRRKLQDLAPASRLFDSPRFTRQLEWAYEEMWRRLLAGEDRRPISVPDI